MRNNKKQKVNVIPDSMASVLSAEEFSRLLGLRLRELENAGGQSRRFDLGGNRVNLPGGGKN